MTTATTSKVETAKKLNVLFLDIETSPNLGWTWGKWEQDVIAFEQEWYVLCFTAKWADSSKVITRSLPDYKSYKTNPKSDKELLASLREILDTADIVVGQNVDKFDLRKINARFAINSILPPSPYKTVDTLKVAKKYFGFTSNKLNDLGVTLGLGEKMDTGGFKLWQGCMNGDMKAWSKMCSYNKQDVLLLEKIYDKLKPWINNHPDVGANKEGTHCHTCGSADIVYRGKRRSKTRVYHTFSCKSCGSWGSETAKA